MLSEAFNRAKGATRSIKGHVAMGAKGRCSDRPYDGRLLLGAWEDRGWRSATRQRSGKMDETVGERDDVRVAYQGALTR